MENIGSDCTALIYGMCEELEHTTNLRKVMEENILQGERPRLTGTNILIHIVGGAQNTEDKKAFFMHCLRAMIEHSPSIYRTLVGLNSMRGLFTAKCDELESVGVDADLVDYYRGAFPRNLSLN